jgi:hypothetical protein
VLEFTESSNFDDAQWSAKDAMAFIAGDVKQRRSSTTGKSVPLPLAIREPPQVGISFVAPIDVDRCLLDRFADPHILAPAEKLSLEESQSLCGTPRFRSASSCRHQHERDLESRDPPRALPLQHRGLESMGEGGMSVVRKLQCHLRGLHPLNQTKKRLISLADVNDTHFPHLAHDDRSQHTQMFLFVL